MSKNLTYLLKHSAVILVILFLFAFALLLRLFRWVL